MKAVEATFNQEKALVGAFSVITNLRMDLFEALLAGRSVTPVVVVMTGSIPCWVSSTGRTIILALWKKYLED